MLEGNEVKVSPIDELGKAVESYEAAQKILNAATILIHDALQRLNPFFVENFDSFSTEEQTVLVNVAAKYDETLSPHDLYWLAATVCQMVRR